MHKGLVGTENLNTELQNLLNPQPASLTKGERCFRLLDKVMQIRNNYDKEVFNGDIGRIVHIDAERREVAVAFDDRQLIYDAADLDELVLAYAISVHKAQGSEFSQVLLVVPEKLSPVLTRRLLYTGITSARDKLIIIGRMDMIAAAMNQDMERYSGIDRMLTSAGGQEA